MYPTQITTIFFITNIAYAFVKQNYPIFFGALPLYTTSLMYHYTKHYIKDSINTDLYKADVFFCVLGYLSALYDYVTRNTIKPPYSTIFVGLHIGLPLTYIVSSRYNILMWNPDPQISEFWHSMFHTIIVIDTNFYLYNS